MKRLIVVAFALILAAGIANAAERTPYNPSANATAEVQAALKQAKTDHKPVLIFFGANWCPDCRALAKTISNEHTARLLHNHFDIVKVDVGQFNRNLGLVKQYGDPIKNGIPAAAIVSPEGRVLYTTRAGELANARHMSAKQVDQLFEKAIKTTDAG